MRSIFAKIALWSFGTLVLCLIGFTMVTFWIMIQTERGIGMMPRLEAFALSEARRAYESGGRGAASAIVDRFDKTLATAHFLVDGTGHDVVSGTDRSAILRLANGRQGPVRTPSGVVFVTSSDDGRYFLISQAPALPEPWRYIPYLALIFLAVALLAWPLAIHIGRPLRKLAAVVDRFGRGDLTARIPFARQDEIGDLARSFNQMADRIETLLVAERRLLQDVSHELRSPLARLAFAVELSATAPDREAAVARVRKEIARLNQLVGALIEVTREEGDPATRQHAAFSLDDLICEVVEDCALEAEQAGREVVLTASVPCKVGGDRELIRRAVENVVRNGAYYSPAGTRVEVSVTASPEMARIQVRDHGPGVPEADLDRIFQPFYRVDESRTVSTGGLGLGLSIAHRALQLHSGQISARNAEPGLLVEIDLPCL